MGVIIDLMEEILAEADLIAATPTEDSLYVTAGLVGGVIMMELIVAPGRKVIKWMLLLVIVWGVVQKAYHQDLNEKEGRRII